MHDTILDNSEIEINSKRLLSNRTETINQQFDLKIIQNNQS